MIVSKNKPYISNNNNHSYTDNIDINNNKNNKNSYSSGNNKNKLKYVKKPVIKEDNVIKSGLENDDDIVDYDQDSSYIGGVFSNEVESKISDTHEVLIKSSNFKNNNKEIIQNQLKNNDENSSSSSSISDSGDETEIEDESDGGEVEIEGESALESDKVYINSDRIKLESKKSSNSFIYVFAFFLLIISAFYIFKDNHNISNNGLNNRNYHKINNSNNTFEYLFTHLIIPKDYSLISDSIKTQIYINSQNSKNDYNYKRPISVHISTNSNNFNNLINYLNSLNSILNVINNNNNSNNNNNNNNNSGNYIFQFDEGNSKSIINRINSVNSASSNIFIFKFSSNGGNLKSIDFGPIEQMIDGVLSNISRNNIYLFLTDIGQKKIKDINPTDQEEKERLVLEESKLLLQHRFLHRVRSTVVI